MKDNIFILDNLFTESQCSKLINYYKKNGPNLAHRDTLCHRVNFEIPIIKYFILKLEKTISKLLHEKIVVDWADIVEWKSGSHQNDHKDFAKQKTIFTSVTYLNDDYVGGETYFKDTFEVIPKIGKTLFFDGQYYTHGVNKIQSNTRYTLASWYKC